MNKIYAAVAAISLFFIIYLAWTQGWLAGLVQHEQLVAWMRQDGIKGPLICIGAQFLQVVIFMIPGEITQIAAGYVFGPWFGFLYSVIGILFGKLFCFSFAKSVGRPIMRRLLGTQRLTRIDKLMRSNRGVTAIFVSFLLPGTPKDAMSYVAGLTGISLVKFVSLSLVARMPALFLSTLFGAEAYDRDYTAMFWIAVVAGLLVVAAIYHQRKRWRNI